MEDFEIRSFGAEAAPKITGGEGSRKVEGYAIVFNQDSRMLYDRQRKRYFVERIEPRAVSESFLRNCDIRMNRNHNDDILLARSRYGEGTLSFSIDEYGVRYSFEMPDTTAGNDTLESIRRGDLFGSSFRFIDAADGVRYEKLNDGKGTLLRTISKFRSILDFSIVTDPAYYGTCVNARSFEGILQDDRQDGGWGAAEELMLMEEIQQY